MSEDAPLVGIIVAGLGLAFLFGTIANRLRLPPIVGYLIAGIAVGPFTPGFVADPHLTLQLAEIGVILLMFGVGLHFTPRDLLSVRAIVVPGALIQMLVIAAFGTAAGVALGWGASEGVVFGLSLSVASTVVVMRALQDRRLTESARGRLATGWLIVQDLLTVLVLVILPPLSGILNGGAIHPSTMFHALGLTLGKLALFVVLMLVVGSRVIPAVLHYIAHTGSRELFRLAVLSVALGVAFLATRLFGVSIALGAFFAGMILASSRLSQRAAEESLPLRDAFAVIFFVSVGMAFNPSVILHAPGALALSVAIVLGGGAVAYLLLRAFGVGAADALTIAVSLAQIGEFSFILMDLGIGMGLVKAEARDLVLGTSILSILLNPLLFAFAARRETSTRGAAAPDLPTPAFETTTLTDHAVLVGYGRVGHLIADNLNGKMPLLVIEEGPVGEPGIAYVRGNAARSDVLAAAKLRAARLLFVAIPQSFEAGQIVQQARKVNPTLPIVARAHFDAEVKHLLACGATEVIMGEREIALAMLSFAQSVVGAKNL
jgi:CPA2 family monovalent cation:H+ antiporter-2